ncbi:glycoside hydrolase family 26 protein [Nocardioides sp. Soil805]|uniref:glycoside hydrolase family 26 protein n=1 Tax=Nocardioides sp. Soil805 TaxID=1736416 RepID=UPI00070242E1|nr:glycosyl hydrolase [Nocardioides sp. Soil805]KRF34625.1 hypothetical protein ASG94_10600 [Nocardioides sp. Soil805]
MLAAAGASEPPTLAPDRDPAASARTTSPATARDRRTPRRAGTRVIVLVAVALVLASAIFTVTGAHAAKARDPLQRHVRLGAWVEGMTLEPARLDALGRELRTDIAVASYYWGYGDVFPAAPELAHSRGGTRDVLLSWDMGETRFVEWSRGDHDAYLDQIAEAALAYPYDVYVRPWPEMNGDWQSFQPTRDGGKAYGGTPTEFVAAWRHVVDHLRAAGVDNLKWVFNPTVDTYAETTRVGDIWPGAGYVDVLGLDGFNWGKDSLWGEWRSFTAVFKKQYQRLTRLHPTAPVWICEVGSKEPRRQDGAPRDHRRSKARWITDMMSARAFPRIDTVVWFNEAKERDWRIESSRGSLRAMRRALR